MKTMQFLLIWILVPRLCYGFSLFSYQNSVRIKDLHTFVQKNAKEIEPVDLWKVNAWHNMHIYAVSKRCKKTDFCKIRKVMAKEMGSDSFLQVIGSSAKLENDVACYLRAFLIKKLKNRTALVYGMTGNGVNGVVNIILQDKSLEARELIVGNLVDDSFAYMSEVCMEELPKYLMYLFDLPGKSSTAFGDDNELADALSDSYVVVGGGPQTIRQMNIALEMGKRVTIMVSRRGTVQENGLVSAGDATFEVMKRWGHLPLEGYNLHAEDAHNSEALELLKSLYLNWEENTRLKELPRYLSKWRELGYLNRIDVIIIE